MTEAELARTAEASEGAPSDEVLAERAIRAYAEYGSRGEAIHVYQRCERALRALGVEPSEPLVAAFREILWHVPHDERPAGAALPRPSTRFIGRERELRDLANAVGLGSVVSIVGPAGVGKTRIAIRVAEQVTSRFGRGIRYLEAAIHDSGSIGPAIHALIGYQHDGGDLLLVIDNVEHVARAVSDTVRSIKSTHPEVAFLLTSRSVLTVAGTILTVSPLGLPLAIDSVELLARSPAIAFFAERALAARPDFRVDSHNAKDVAALCGLLDGVPLALELAAAQLRFLAPAELHKRLGSHPHAHGDALLREQISASFSLLEPEERRFAARLSVYDRRWTIDESDVIGGRSSFDLMVRLVRRSLVQVDEIAGETVYRFLESTYAFAREELEETDDANVWEATALRGAREAVVARLGRDGGVLSTADTQYLRVRLPNLRRALDVWSVHDPAAAIDIALATRLFWDDEGFHRDAVTRLRRLAALMPNADGTVRYALHRAIGGHLVKLQELEPARAALREALSIVAESRDVDALHECTIELASAAYEGADYDEARSLILSIISTIPEDSHHWSFANGLLGHIATALGDFAEANKHYDLIANVPRQPSREANYLRNRAYVSALAGHRDEAFDFLRAALAAAANPAVGAVIRASVYSAAGFVYFRGNEAPAAMLWFSRSIIELAGTNTELHMMYIVEDAACALGALGKHDEAVMLLAAVARERSRAGTPPDFSALAIFNETRAAARSALGNPGYERSEIRGKTLDLRKAAELVLKLAGESSPELHAVAALSPRESAVAVMIAAGATNREIAERLSVSAKTIEKHVSSIFVKLRLTRRSQIAAIVSRNAATTA
ncbi:MAG: BTAD domain-containing putative transcriptional regulator [Candidatus Velthaea sp.]